MFEVEPESATRRRGEDVMSNLKPQASFAFACKVMDSLKWIVESCWAENLQINFKKLNEIFRAGRALGVAEIRDLTEEEIGALVETLTPFKTLDMKEQVREVTVAKLVELGFKPEFFEPKGPAAK